MNYFWEECFPHCLEWIAFDCWGLSSLVMSSGCCSVSMVSIQHVSMVVPRTPACYQNDVREQPFFYSQNSVVSLIDSRKHHVPSNAHEPNWNAPMRMTSSIKWINFLVRLINTAARRFPNKAARCFPIELARCFPDKYLQSRSVYRNNIFPTPQQCVRETGIREHKQCECGSNKIIQ